MNPKVFRYLFHIKYPKYNFAVGTEAVIQPLDILKTLVIAVISSVGVIILAKNVMEFVKAYLLKKWNFNAFINSGLLSFTGNYADWAKTLIYLCEITFTIALTVGSVHKTLNQGTWYVTKKRDTDIPLVATYQTSRYVYRYE